MDRYLFDVGPINISILPAPTDGASQDVEHAASFILLSSVHVAPTLLKMKYLQALKLLAAVAAPVRAAFSWSTVKIGGGGGFVPGISFHPKTKGLAYARTDIGGLYRLNADESWTAITDSITTDENW